MVIIITINNVPFKPEILDGLEIAKPSKKYIA